MYVCILLSGIELPSGTEHLEIRWCRVSPDYSSPQLEELRNMAYPAFSRVNK